MMKKKHKVVMLATDSIDLNCIGKYKDGVLGRVKALQDNNHFVLDIPSEGISVENNKTVQLNHLYFTSDEEIKEGDWITDTYRVWQWKDDCSLLGRKKVLATTDPKLMVDFGKGNEKGKVFIPQIPQSFIESYCKNPVDEVELEYECAIPGIDISMEPTEQPMKLKLVNNEVVIQEVKEKLYTKDDLMKLHEHICEQASHYVITINECEQWIKDNL